MDYLDMLESQSVYMIREAYKKFNKLAMLWSVGKDSILGDSKLFYKINGKLGWGSIEDLYEAVTPKEVHKKGKKELIIPKEKVEVLTVAGKNQKSASVKFGRVTVLISHVTDKDIYDVQIQTKKHIKVTGDHSLIGVYSNNNGLLLGPIETRKLTKKDLIFCPNNLNFDVKDLGQQNNVELKEYLLVLAGLWLADGCYAVDRKIIISTGKNSGILNFLKKIPREKTVTELIAEDLVANTHFDGQTLAMNLAKELGQKYGVSFWSAYNSKKRLNSLLNKKENIYTRLEKNGDVWICSKKLVSKLKKLGFEGTGKDKKIPDWLYTASNKQIALFLAGFFAGDGSCWKTRDNFAISFSGMNKDLIEGIRPLLLRLGISHGFSISSAESSGFKTKNKEMYQITISSVKGIKNFLKHIPDLANKLKKIKISRKGVSNYQLSARLVKETKKLPKKQRKVYDLEVDSTHNFIANGIVCHNSTAILWLARKAFFGNVPIPVIHIDTGKKFQEMYDFRDECVKKWGLKLIVAQNKEADKMGIGPKDKIKCCDMRKTQALKQTIAENGFEALLLGIRRDEHGVRAKERFFSPRNRDFQWNYKEQLPELWDQFKSKKETEQHLRVHPLLHWTELDVWEYVKRENLPVNPLYFAKNGKRYRSLGCEPCTKPVESSADTIDKIIEEIKNSKISERGGRAQDKEEANAMQKLRALGYM